MFLVDCHCDTLSELYKQNKSLYANDLMLDAARIIKNGGGLQFMAMFIPTEVFRAGAGATYTLKLIDTYLRGPERTGSERNPGTSDFKEGRPGPTAQRAVQYTAGY